MKTQLTATAPYTGIGRMLATTLFVLCLPGIIVWQAIHTGDHHLIGLIAGAIIVLLSFKAVAAWLINTVWPVIAEYTNDEFKHDFHQLTPLQKILVVAGFYLLIVYALIASLGVIN